MGDRSQSRLASVIMLLLGIWVVVSPTWITMPQAAVISTVITGAVIGILGIIQFFMENSVPSWITGIAAIWLFISAFSFGMSTGAAWDLVISAVIAFILAIWDGREITVFSEHHHHAHA